MTLGAGTVSAIGRVEECAASPETWRQSKKRVKQVFVERFQCVRMGPNVLNRWNSKFKNFVVCTYLLCHKVEKRAAPVTWRKSKTRKGKKRWRNCPSGDSNGAKCFASMELSLFVLLIPHVGTHRARNA